MTDPKGPRVTDRKEYCVGKTVVNSRVCEIWNRKEEHDLGKNNGKSPNLWLKQTFSDTDKFDWVPWIDDCGTSRPCYEVSLVQQNRTKQKWGETRINSRCIVKISCNTKVVYEFFCHNVAYGLARSQILITKMGDHPFDFSDPKKEIGRKIWFYDQAAVISDLTLSQGCIIAKKEDGTGFDLTKPWDREDSVDYWNGKNEVKDDIFSKNIYWFRD